MAIKIRIPKKLRGVAERAWRQQFNAVKLVGIAGVLVALTFVSVFAYYFLKFDRIVDRRIRGQIFSNTAQIYSLPHTVTPGQKISADEIASALRRAGYSEVERKVPSTIGTYRVMKAGIEIKPGPNSYHSQDGAVIRIDGGKVERIVGTGSSDGQGLSAYELEPQLLTALDYEQRSKRQLVRYQEIPKVLVDAILAIEDRRYFQHGGINPWRLVQAAWVDIRQGGKEQGGSTITMQVARGFFLTPQKTVRRKLAEIFISIDLERKLNKQQIFELYANQVYMGQRGSYTINGLGEASRSYFNKDMQSLSLPEAALLAGLIQRPNYLSPYKYPERALDRRNLVLDAMAETGAVKRDEAERGKATPLKLAPPNVEASDAPYFVDLVKDMLQSKYSERDLNEQALRIYTTLDTDLQSAAAAAVEQGIKQVDEKVKKLRTRKVKVGKGKNAKTEIEIRPGPMAQVALIAMDPHTGEVLALVGGRNYGFSQLNHAVARRPTGSIFKPFVYAAAINSALDGNPTPLTAASMVDDSPTTFTYGDQIYEPRNYKNEYHGMVSARFALAHSLNNATVKLAEMVGYDKVAALAKAAGINSVQATPAMALGAYDATPLDMASAYTTFANDGVRVTPELVHSVANPRGEILDTFEPTKTLVLDPRVAYVMTTMMEGVINNGTGFPVRAMGFNAPAAGKTGTSHDGWFAGYTSNLLCVVWVGFDDYSDLRLSGADTAAPIWGAFMKKAVTLPQYRDVRDFQQPSGVVDVRVDKVTNLLATSTCPDTYSVAFIAGTEPTDTCDHADHRGFFSRLFGVGSSGPAVAAPPPGVPGRQPAPNTSVAVQNAGQAQPPEKKKKGFFGKILGVFGGDDNQQQQQQQPQPPPPQPPPAAPPR